MLQLLYLTIEMLKTPVMEYLTKGIIQAYNGCSAVDLSLFVTQTGLCSSFHFRDNYVKMVHFDSRTVAMYPLTSRSPLGWLALRRAANAEGLIFQPNVSNVCFRITNYVDIFQLYFCSSTLLKLRCKSASCPYCCTLSYFY